MNGRGAPAAPLRVLRGSDVPPRRQIALRIAGRIHDGSYPYGARLPSVRALGGRLGVHRDTVLAAYRELERGGLVRTVPGGGVFVESWLPPFPELLDAGAPGLGLRLASLGAAVRLRRILVLADEDELGATVGRELEELLGGARVRVRLAVAEPLPGLDFGWLPLRVRACLPPSAEERPPDGAPPGPRPAALRTVPVQVGPGEGLLRRLATLRFPDVVGIVSTSPAVLRLAREAVRAVAGPEVGVVAASPRDGRAMRRVRARANFLLRDGSVRTSPAPGAEGHGRPSIRIRLVPARLGSELLALLGPQERNGGSRG
jgi:hypothetical protein